VDPRAGGLHQDSWNWKDKTLVFGFLPIGLAYHAGFTILCGDHVGLHPPDLAEASRGARARAPAGGKEGHP
jgi:hypothetical protein